mgnify:CR=1 FL=1
MYQSLEVAENTLAELPEKYVKLPYDSVAKKQDSVKVPQHTEWTKEQAWKELMAFNLERIPEFFDKSSVDVSFRKFRLAMQNAGYLI